jgi:hypothetical protein
VRCPVEAGSIEYSAGQPAAPVAVEPARHAVLERRRAQDARLAERDQRRAARLLEEVGLDRQLSKLVRAGRPLGRLMPRPPSSSAIAPARLAERKLQEALADRPEALRIAGRQEPVDPSRPCSFSMPLRSSVSATSRAVLLGREDERHAAPKTRWKIGRMQRVVRAAEDDRVHAGLLERLGVFAHRLDRSRRERLVALDQRNRRGQATEKKRTPRVERAHELRRSARGDGGLGREAGRCVGSAVVCTGRVRLGRDHADDRNLEPFLELGQRGRASRRCRRRRRA